MPRMWRWIAMVVAATAVIAMPTAAWAKFTSSSSASLKVTAATLDPPSGVTLAKSCAITSLSGRTMTVSWTASADTDVAGYVVTQTTTANNSSTTTSVNGRTTTSTTVSATIGVTYTITVASTRGNWTSSAVAAPNSFSCGIFG